MLGAAGMVNADQIQDCLDRGWVVVVPNYRLCPQVNLLEGPMRDVRDLLAWIQDGHLEAHIAAAGSSPLTIDQDHIFAFGTSSGGHLALSLVGPLSRLDSIVLNSASNSVGLRRPPSRGRHLRHVRRVLF